MDKLVLEREVAVENKKEEEQQIEVKKEEKLQTQKTETPIHTQYLDSLENMTIGDFKKQEEEKIAQSVNKDELIQQQYQQKEEKQESQNIIEKPNYDFIEENKKVIKLRKNLIPEAKNEKKNKKSIIFAVGLAICGVLATTNITLLDSYSSNLANLEQEFYNVNLPKYLKNISNLDTTKKSMEFIETYPEEIQNAGDLGEQSNWYDKLTNFISGVFGG